MKFAVNFSKEAEKLIKNNDVQIDMFKCPNFSKELIIQAESSKPCYVHSGLYAGSGQIHTVNWDVIDGLRRHT
ncbi:hypothetical protein [Gracilibacillus kekensis]|uniref:Uncharacterized protein n=1 Tax=Gracilibacillus kekensis TaxID=1027249 RepID=A0A1M7QG33_9BACI|nr:hypothetical protein [Gracilibacillus kekensis]SHN29911.1 hypothetical protein SAMN05216179_3115 [Gracilibacillus kekensis]